MYCIKKKLMKNVVEANLYACDLEKIVYMMKLTRNLDDNTF